VTINLSSPSLQIGFAFTLKEVRERMLVDALQSCVRKIDLKSLDSQLHNLVDDQALKRLASFGIRGELLFAVPCVLESHPELLGYYRLLLGYSQKSFYTSESGVSQFKSMEEKGTISLRQKSLLTELCIALCGSASILINGLADFMLTHQFLDDLTLLTLGPQLRGGANVQRGTAATIQVFNLIHDVVKSSVIQSSKHQIEIENASGRKVYIEFAPDPDIVIREKIRGGTYRNLVAIEIKGGQDYSNIHNRVGEAEKSHQKAKLLGYVECWTVVNVDRMDIGMAKKESPSTNRFFRISDLLNPNSEESQAFKGLVVSCVGIK
jgi:hypothetical protein